MTNTSTAAQILAAGEAMFGDHWIVPLARQLNINERTLRRLRTAVEAGQLYPVAPGVPSALARVLRQRAALLEQMAAQVEAAPPAGRSRPPPAAPGEAPAAAHGKPPGSPGSRPERP